MIALLFAAAIMSPFYLLLSPVVSIAIEKNVNADPAKMYWKNSEIIDSFKKTVMDKNVTLRDTALVVPVLYACYDLGNAVFAEKVWNYITSHCMTKPTQLIYSKLLSIYQKVEHVNVFKCIQLVQTYMDQCEEYRPSSYARKQPKTPYHSPIILNQMIKIILFRSHWSNTTIREHIRRYQHDMIRLNINPDPETIRLFGIASVQPMHDYQHKHYHYNSADGSKTFDNYTLSMYYRHYRHWLHMQTPTSASKIIDSFQKNVMDPQITLLTTQVIAPVFGACYYLKDAAFASKVWDYIAHYCKMKPNQVLYSKLLTIYQSVRPVNVEKCKQLAMQWIDEYEHDPESLRHGLSTVLQLREPLAFDSPIILNQIMKIILFKSRGNRVEGAHYFYNQMIRLNIKPDSETNRLIHGIMRHELPMTSNGSLHSTNERREVDDIFENLENLESYLLTEFTALIQSHDAQSWNDIRRLFNTYVIEDRMNVTSHLLVGLVFDACIKLRDVAFIEEVWQYMTNANATKCPIKPNGRMFYEVLCVYKSADMVNKCFNLTHQWVAQYRQDDDSVQPSAMLNTMMHMVLWKENWAIPRRLMHVRDCYFTMIWLGIEPDDMTQAIVNQMQKLSMLSERPMSQIQTNIQQQIITRELESYLFTMFTRLLQLSDAKNCGILIKLFGGFVIEQKVLLTNNVLLELVLDACIRLKDIEFGGSVWEYIMSDVKVKPTQLLYSKMMDLYRNTILVTNYQTVMDLTDNWIEQYQMDKESLQAGGLVAGQWESDIIQKMMNIIRLKTGTIMTDAERIKQINKYAKVMIDLGIQINIQFAERIANWIRSMDVTGGIELPPTRNITIYS
eukprot:448137_1